MILMTFELKRSCCISWSCQNFSALKPASQAAVVTQLMWWLSAIAFSVGKGDILLSVWRFAILRDRLPNFLWRPNVINNAVLNTGVNLQTKRLVKLVEGKSLLKKQTGSFTYSGSMEQIQKVTDW